MANQQYLKKVRELSEMKSSLYALASHKLGNDDKAGAKATYAEIDAIDAEIDEMMKANEEEPVSEEDLTLKFNN